MVIINAKKIIIFVLLIIAFTSSCKKDNDTVTTQSIHGQVYNLCTDSGMANITVYLQQNGSNIAQTNSGANGNFSFSNVQIHSSSDYSYGFYIHSESGIGSGSPTGFDGVDVDINKSSISSFFTLNVVPHFNNWYLYLPFSAQLDTDTFTLVIQQNIFHKNLPNGNYQFIWPFNPPLPPPPLGYTSGELGLISNYPMGWWNLKTDKVKNGIHPIKTDSVYIGYGAVVKDTIPW